MNVDASSYGATMSASTSYSQITAMQSNLDTVNIDIGSTAYYVSLTQNCTQSAPLNPAFLSAWNALPTSPCWLYGAGSDNNGCLNVWNLVNDWGTHALIGLYTGARIVFFASVSSQANQAVTSMQVRHSPAQVMSTHKCYAPSPPLASLSGC